MVTTNKRQRARKQDKTFYQDALSKMKAYMANRSDDEVAAVEKQIKGLGLQSSYDDIEGDKRIRELCSKVKPDPTATFFNQTSVLDLGYINCKHILLNRVLTNINSSKYFSMSLPSDLIPDLNRILESAPLKVYSDRVLEKSNIRLYILVNDVSNTGMTNV